MTSTYSTHAAICAKFYELTLDPESVGRFIQSRSRIQTHERVLFVGGMFRLAKFLVDSGYSLTVVDYSDEMVDVGRVMLPKTRVERADLRALPFQNEFDLILVVGRVFTHMLTDQDLLSAFRSCRGALRSGGRLFFDNYEDTKIQQTSYFNGRVNAEEGETKIIRDSTTTLVSRLPFVVRWDAEYFGDFEGRAFGFKDSMEHRAWSRTEIIQFLTKVSLEILEQGDNFDETSFFTLAQEN